jgi:hypothetical protein
MTDLDLFGDPITEPEPIPEKSAGQKLTERLRAISDSGVNPLLGTTGPEGETCGTCVFRKLYGGHAKSYPKCELGPQTSGPKTDVRRYWPACHRWEARP